MFRVAQALACTTFNGANHAGLDTNYIIQTPAGVLYNIYGAGEALGNLQFAKSTDHGLTWSQATTISSQPNSTQWSVWYDRWSNISAGLIHCAYTNSSTDDTLYRTINTESSDALSTETTIFAGASTAAQGGLSVVRAVGGNVYCRTCIDAGAEGGFYRLPNANVPSGAWDAARTVNEALAVSDQMILLPDLNSADNQDIYGIFWDSSADEISRQNYDDSANTWAETSISGSMVDLTISGSNSSWPHYAAAVDLTNSQTVLIAWTGVDTLNADLKCWTINSTTVTAKTDVVTNSTDDQGLAAIGIDTDTGYWYAFYAGASDGSETFGTDVNVYMKVSTDSGTTWGAETRISTDNYTQNVTRLWCIPRFTGMWACMMGLQNTLGAEPKHTIHCLSPKIQARAQTLLGV